MNPSSWICRALYRIHPHLRLAWHGRAKAHENELNPGSFALIQLYHISDVQGLDDPSTFRLTWVANPVEAADGTTRMERVNRGPVFNKDGGARADWDTAFRIPMFVATLDEAYGLSTEDVLSGRFLNDVRRWMVPIEKRVKDSAIEAGRNLNSEAEDIAGEIADATVFESKKPDATTVIMANKHAKKDMQKFYDKKEKSHDSLTDYYLPPEV